MRRSRTVLLALLAALALSLVAAPAQALGKRCETSSSVERCAKLEASSDGDDIIGPAEVDSLRARVKVKLVSIALQRRTDDGWDRVSRFVPLNEGFFDGDSGSTEVPCSDVAGGVFRTRAVVAWRVRGEDRTHTDAVVSRGVRKSRLCG